MRARAPLGWGRGVDRALPRGRGSLKCTMLFFCQSRCLTQGRYVMWRAPQCSLCMPSLRAPFPCLFGSAVGGSDAGPRKQATQRAPVDAVWAQEGFHSAAWQGNETSAHETCCRRISMDSTTRSPATQSTSSCRMCTMCCLSARSVLGPEKRSGGLEARGLEGMRRGMGNQAIQNVGTQTQLQLIHHPTPAHTPPNSSSYTTQLQLIHHPPPAHTPPNSSSYTTQLQLTHHPTPAHTPPNSSSYTTHLQLIHHPPPAHTPPNSSAYASQGAAALSGESKSGTTTPLRSWQVGGSPPTQSNVEVLFLFAPTHPGRDPMESPTCS